MYPKVLLALSGIIFLAYGIVCWVDPEIPAKQAGLFIATHNGYAEMAAMYGGLQGSFGAILIASAFIKGYVRPGSVAHSHLHWHPGRRSRQRCFKRPRLELSGGQQLTGY